jgi:hypothetical protein
MQHGAGVGRKKSGARIPSACLATTLLTDLPRSLFCTRHRFTFLPGSGLRVECDVTHSKQTSAPFLPGSRIAPHGLRQGTASAVPNAQSSIANALSNRELQLLERTVTHRKQTIAPRSNRELSTNRCFGNSHSVNPIPSFLPGSGLQVESVVTHSKQTTEPFLPGSRIVTKRLVSRTVFHPVSSELFPTHRRISLQDGIAHNRLVAASPRMHALVGRP